MIKAAALLLLLTLAAPAGAAAREEILQVCWGPESVQCGDLLRRMVLPAGAERKLVNYYVVRLADGSVSLVEPDLIIRIGKR